MQVLRARRSCVVFSMASAALFCPDVTMAGDLSLRCGATTSNTLRQNGGDGHDVLGAKGFVHSVGMPIYFEDPFITSDLRII